MRRNRSFTTSSRRQFTGAVLLLLLSLTALGQQPAPSATVRVVTRDQANAPVPGVQARLKRAGAAVSGATTNEQGEAALINLAPGAYGIVVAKEGFETLNESKINATAGSSPNTRFTLGRK